MKPQLLLIVLAAARSFATPLPVVESNAAVDAELDERQFDFRVIRNELGECKPITVIYARGTIELGNVGSLAGPPFFNALDVKYGADKIGVQGVDYPATFGGYLVGGDPGGAATLASLTEQAASQCPDSKIVLSGYSQGAQVVHLGVAKLSPETAGKVDAVVCFSYSGLRES